MYFAINGAKTSHDIKVTGFLLVNILRLVILFDHINKIFINFKNLS
mgnify:CR=1 FL=1